MERMLVVVFDTESKAYEGKRALLQLDREDAITLFAYAVLEKNGDGTSTLLDSKDVAQINTLIGTSLGSLIGLLGGPVGLGIGAGIGYLAGVTADFNNARIDGGFVDEVAKALVPNTFAVVAEVEEEWTTSVDTRMEAIGGTVFRRALSEVTYAVHEQDVAAMKADIAQLKAEHRKALADRKAALAEKINQLDTKIQAQLEKAKERRRATKARAHAKAEMLKEKAAEAKAKAAS